MAYFSQFESTKPLGMGPIPAEKGWTVNCHLDLLCILIQLNAESLTKTKHIFMFRITWAFRKYMYQLCLIKMKIDDFTEIAVTESVNRASRNRTDCTTLWTKLMFILILIILFPLAPTRVLSDKCFLSYNFLKIKIFRNFLLFFS